MTTINAYLNFAGKCREGMDFYKECFGGELTIITVAESPLAGQMPAQYNDQVLHSSLEREGLVIMGTDMTREAPVSGNTVYMCLNCGSVEEVDSLFAKMSEGGQVVDPLADTFWGRFATLVDKFGMKWMLNYDNRGK